MTIKHPPLLAQPPLFEMVPDKPIRKPGEARTRFGAVVNEIVNALLGLQDIPNSGTHDCVFDSYLRSRGAYVEVKSLRRRNKIPVYQWRIEKDKEAGVPLLYVIGVHNCTRQATLAGVWNKMAETMDQILVLPAAVIEELAAAEPLQAIKSAKTASGERNGYQRKGYCEGYKNIPWEKLVAATAGGLVRVYDAKVHGLFCKALVKFHPEVRPWL